MAGNVLTIEGQTFVTESVASGVDVTTVAGMEPAPGVDDEPALVFAGATITRQDGRAWTLDGFTPGQRIVVQGSALNDGNYLIDTLLGAVMTLAAGTVLVAETTDPLDPAATPVEVVAVISLILPELVFSGHTITRSFGSWTADGFVVGGRMTVDETIRSNGQFAIASISADGRTLTVVLDPTVTFSNEYTRYAVINGLVPYNQVNGGEPLTVGGVTDLLKQQLGTVSTFFKFIAQVVFQKSTAELVIGTGADIQAAGNLTVKATATSILALKTESLWIGITYGRSEATATVDIATGACLKAAGNVTLEALVTNTMAVTTVIKMGLNPKAMFVQQRLTGRAGLIPGPAFLASVGEGRSTSRGDERGHHRRCQRHRPGRQQEHVERRRQGQDQGAGRGQHRLRRRGRRDRPSLQRHRRTRRSRTGDRQPPGRGPLGERRQRGVGGDRRQEGPLPAPGSPRAQPPGSQPEASTSRRLPTPAPSPARRRPSSPTARTRPRRRSSPAPLVSTRGNASVVAYAEDNFKAIAIGKAKIETNVRRRRRRRRARLPQQGRRPHRRRQRSSTSPVRSSCRPRRSSRTRSRSTTSSSERSRVRRSRRHRPRRSVAATPSPSVSRSSRPAPR